MRFPVSFDMLDAALCVVWGILMMMMMMMVPLLKCQNCNSGV